MSLTAKIHPLDIDANKAVGIALPLNSNNQNFFKLNYTTKDQARTNLKMLINTVKGERVMRPSYGTNVRKILFEPDNSNLVLNVQEDIKSAIATWLPYLTVNSITLEVDSDKHIVYISINYNLSHVPADTEDVVIELNL